MPAADPDRRQFGAESEMPLAACRVPPSSETHDSLSGSANSRMAGARRKGGIMAVLIRGLL